MMWKFIIITSVCVVFIGILIILASNTSMSPMSYQPLGKQKEINLKCYEADCKRLFTEKQFKNSHECPERLATYYYIEPDSVVLELGGSVGSVSSVIAHKLYDPKNLVVVEPSSKYVIVLKKLRKTIQKNFNIFNGVLTDGKTFMECMSKDMAYAECKVVTSPHHTTNKTFLQLQKIYGLKFDTLVIDCEGCYSGLFNDSIKSGWLDQIKTIIIEWDGKHMHSFLINTGFKQIAQYDHSEILNGIGVYKK